MSDDQCHEEAGSSGPDGSVARAMEKCRNGDDSEFGRMVFGFHSLLLEKARAKMRKAPNLQSISDCEGVVSSAMGSYWRGVQGGPTLPSKALIVPEATALERVPYGQYQPQQFRNRFPT